jgi:hypothetical protein
VALGATRIAKPQAAARIFNSHSLLISTLPIGREIPRPPHDNLTQFDYHVRTVFPDRDGTSAGGLGGWHAKAASEIEGVEGGQRRVLRIESLESRTLLDAGALAGPGITTRVIPLEATGTQATAQSTASAV